MSEVRNWRKARVMDAPAHRHVRKWLRSGLDDFRANLGISLCYGLGAVIAVWSVLGILILTGLGWLILPLCAGAMMLWPVMTVGLYKIAAGEGETPRTAAGQIFLASVIIKDFPNVHLSDHFLSIRSLAVLTLESNKTSGLY